MKTPKQRQKQVKLLKHELQRIYTSSSSLIIRRSVRRALEMLKYILKFFSTHDSDISKLKNNILMLRSNNLGLARGLQNERENSKTLVQDRILAESSYHDLLKEHVLVKKELWNAEQILISYDEELKNSMIPNLVKLSDDITKFKVKSNILRKNIETKRNSESQPRNTWSNSRNFGTGCYSNQLVSAVNPMVKGCVVQKPIINVPRMSLPRDGSRNSLFANVDIGSPIIEEDSGETMTRINNSSRRCKNGLRHMLHLSKGQPSRRSAETFPISGMSYCDTSEDSDNDINLRMEPVVRLSDVTRLLQNSTFRISETENPDSPAKENFTGAVRNQCSPEVVLQRIATPKSLRFENSIDNPLEGCSWMYQSSPTNAYGESEYLSPHNQNLWNEQQRNISTDHNISVDRRSSGIGMNSAQQQDSEPEINSLMEQSFGNNLRVSNSKNSGTLKTPNSFRNDSVTPLKTEKLKRMETTIMTSTLNSSVLSKSTKKRFFRKSSETDESSFSGTVNDIFIDVDPVAVQSVNDEVECTSTSSHIPDLEVVNSPKIPSLLLQNCTKRRNGRRSRKSSQKFVNKELRHSDTRLDDVEEFNEHNSVAFSFDGISSKRSVRSIRSSRQSKRINYCETVGFEDETDETKAEDQIRKKSKSRKSKKTVEESNPNQDITSSAVCVSSSDKRKMKKSRTTADDSVSESMSRSRSSLSLNECTSVLESTRTIRVSGRNRANVSYKEQPLKTKLRRDR